VKPSPEPAQGRPLSHERGDYRCYAQPPRQYHAHPKQQGILLSRYRSKNNSHATSSHALNCLNQEKPADKEGNPFVLSKTS